MAASTVVQPLVAAQPAAFDAQRISTMCHQPDSRQDGGVFSQKRKCPSPADALQPAASVLDLDSSGSRGSGDSDCFTLDPAAFSRDASPESQQQLSFRPRTPGNYMLGKRRRLSLGSSGGSALLGSASFVGSCGATPPSAAGHPEDASPASADLLRVPSVPPPIAALQSSRDPACEQVACSSCQLFDIGAAQPAVPQPASGDALAPMQPHALPCGQELLQQQVAAQQAHHQQLLAAQQWQQQQRAAQHAVASIAMLRANALSRCATMPAVYRQPQLQQHPQLQEIGQQHGCFSWAPEPALKRLRRSVSDNGAAAASHMPAYPPLGYLPTFQLPASQQPPGVQPFSELLAAAERRRCIPQLHPLRTSHSVGSSQHGSAPQAAHAAAATPAPAPFTFTTRSAHAAYSQPAPALPAPLFSLRPRVGVPQGAQLPLQPQHLAAASGTSPPKAPAQRRWPPAGASGGAGGAPQLVARWARSLPLHRGETLLLALHMWERLQRKVKPQELLRRGCPQPWQAALLGCLWAAAKLEERRRGLPTASKIGELLGLDRKVVASVELYVMEALEWAPTAGWQTRRREFRA